MLTILSGLWFGHITSILSGDGWDGVSCFRKVSGSCAVYYGGMRSPVATFKILDPVWINPTG